MYRFVTDKLSLKICLLFLAARFGKCIVHTHTHMHTAYFFSILLIWQSNFCPIATCVALFFGYIFRSLATREIRHQNLHFQKAHSNVQMARIVTFLSIVLLAINCHLALGCQPLNPPLYLGPSAAGRLPLQLNGPGAAKFHDSQGEGPSAKETDGTFEMPKLNRIGKVGDDKLFGENSQLLKMNIVRRIEGEKAALFDPIPTTTEEVPPTTTMTTTPLAPFGGCQPNTASVLAVTNIPYQEATVQQEFNALTSKLGLLETFVGFKLASFGNYFVQPIKEGQNFALRIYFTNAVGDCDQMRDFTGKTVSYSKEIEYAIFSCRCGEAWMISKIH